MTAKGYHRSVILYLLVLLLGMVLMLLMTQVIAAQSDTQGTAAPEQVEEADTVFCDLTVNTVGLGDVNVTNLNEDPELNITVADDFSQVTLENSQIFVRFREYTSSENGGTIDEFAITDFIIKSEGQDQVREFLDADSGRGALKDLTVVDEEDRKSVRFKWAPLSGGADIEHEYTIYPNAPFLKIDYINVKKGEAIVDLAEPGGSRTQGTHVAYGGDTWIRDYVYLFDDPGAEDTVGSYYNRYPGDNVNDPADGGSLNYNDHFILANINVTNGNGIGRVFPVDDISIIKLLINPNTRRGAEWYPHPFFLDHAPFTGYLYAVTDGPEEAIAYGQRLADSGGTDFGFNCGDVVELEAVAGDNYRFDSWTGDLTGSENPAQLTIDGQNEVTANFVPDKFELNITTDPADGSGGTVAKNPDKDLYEPGEVVQITATPASDCWDFAGWSGDVTGTELVQDITMDASKDITATFSREEFTLAVSTIGEGAVELNPDKSTYMKCEEVTLTAVPGLEDNVFLRWGGDLATYQGTNPLTVSVEDDIVGSAEFGYQFSLPAAFAK